MSNIYYKVTKNKGIFIPEVIQSAFIWGDAQVIYKIDEWAEAPQWLAEKGYHLLVFATYNTASEYMGIEDTLYLCECEEEIKELPPICDPLELSASNIVPTKLNHGEPDRWPLGTRMFKRVKLLSRIG